MSEQVLIRPLSPVLPSLRLLREARQVGASHGRVTRFRGRFFAQLARTAVPDYCMELMSFTTEASGVVIGPALEREQWIVFAWQDGDILCLRVADEVETTATLHVLSLQQGFNPDAVTASRPPTKLDLTALFPAAQCRTFDSDWPNKSAPLPSLRRKRFGPVLTLTMLALITPWLWSYMSQEPEVMVQDQTNEQSIGHQLEQANSSVVDLLRHHQVLVEQLTSLAGWDVEQVAWTGSGFLVHLQQRSGDLHDLHQFTQLSAMQLQATERGRALFWPIHLLPVAEHANLSLMGTVAQGDWLEDLIRNGFSDIQIQRDFTRTAAGDGWHAQRMILRFQDWSAVDLHRLNQLLYVHPVRLVQFHYRQQNPDNVYLGYQGHLTFDYFGVSL
ncbi:hypothetical protein FM042_00265 [Aliidiomarina halalkaliphila]|uniref:Uncharacterized protein n=1 Tax=Aliidiomarina halalkaliphila TaxID=2593535 RepID=A0A552X308_9GAMM|nr:hypothetical protein [Aliidiomarina halalkaliphila]TRW49346.1 hypothetical protein FM042_00265 [Aliidiomarina halalkaliphila]